MRTTTRIQVKKNQEDMKRERLEQYSTDDVQCLVPEDSPSPYYYIFTSADNKETDSVRVFEHAYTIGQNGVNAGLWDYFHVHFIVNGSKSCHLICRKDVQTILSERDENSKNENS